MGCPLSTPAKARVAALICTLFICWPAVHRVVVAIGLFIRRVRPLALCAAMALVVAIEVAAREVLFGALYLGLIALFARRALNWQLLPIFVALYAYLLAAGLGFVPTWGAH